MKAELKSGTLVALWSIIILGILPVFSQIDQTIYYQYCVARPDSSCFVPLEGAVDTVGRDVAALGGSFRICLELDTVDSGFAPVRVILVLDESRSMCHNPMDSADGCCTAGDGTGNCMMNDPDDMRVQAAIAFVDSLAAKSPQSQIGVVAYSINTSEHAPISLDNQNNIDRIHEWIESAGCEANFGSGGIFFGGLGKTAATKATYLGLGMQAGFDLVDEDYEDIPLGMARHIIQLTDGAWDDQNASTASPDTIINRYKERFPERTVPTFHGVFLSNAELHVAHGYPAEGCSNTDPVLLDKLERATTLTGGMYFPGSTPSTVVDNFNTLLDTIAQTAPQQLVSLTVTNAANSETSSNGAIVQVGGATSPNWETTLNNLPLEFGSNVLTVQRTIRKASGRDSVITTTVTVVRSELYRESIDTDLFKQYCELVEANIRITASPDVVLQNTPVNVNATITGASNFHLDTVQVRVFTRFPDSENGVLATFHLDGDLKNSARTGDDGVGSDATHFTTTDALYGSGAINVGSFQYSLPQLADAFVLEEWVKPGSNEAAVIMKSAGFEIGVDADMKLYFRNETGVVVSAAIPLDDGVWSHVGVARTNGNVTLFVNGIAVSNPVPYATVIGGGALTISNPQRWVTDEVRISNVSRITADGATTVLAIPTVYSVSWVLGVAPSKSEVLSVPVSAWTDGSSLDFTFATEVAGRLVVNIRQKESGDVGTGWSKNGNPITVASDLEPPFVKEAVLTPGRVAGTQTYDTLLIKFNEEVNCATLKESDPFTTFTVSRDDRDMQTLLQGATYADPACALDYISEVVLIVKSGISPDRDSMRISSEAAVDRAGNKSPILNGKKGDIIWGKGVEVEIFPMESGDKEHPMVISPSVKIRIPALKETNGKVIGITSKREFKKVGEDYGRAEVYDPVGNLVRSNLKIGKTELPGTYYVFWDGMNRKGRRVGNGAYLIRFFYEYSDNSKGSRSTKIALKW